jgi:hypothetical protein
MKAKNFGNLVLAVAALLAAGISIAAPADAAGCLVSERVSVHVKQLVGTESGFQTMTLTFTGTRPGEQDAIIMVRHKPSADAAASDVGILLYGGDRPLRSSPLGAVGAWRLSGPPLAEG